jgi:hypothetical protein
MAIAMLVSFFDICSAAALVQGTTLKSTLLSQLDSTAAPAPAPTPSVGEDGPAPCEVSGITICEPWLEHPGNPNKCVAPAGQHCCDPEEDGGCSQDFTGFDAIKTKQWLKRCKAKKCPNAGSVIPCEISNILVGAPWNQVPGDPTTCYAPAGQDCCQEDETFGCLNKFYKGTSRAEVRLWLKTCGVKEGVSKPFVVFEENFDSGTELPQWNNDETTGKLDIDFNPELGQNSGTTSLKFVNDASPSIEYEKGVGPPMSTEMIHIGRSGGPLKELSIGAHLTKCFNVPLQASGARSPHVDTYLTTVSENGGRLSVRRVDKATIGWGQDLYIRCHQYEKGRAAVTKPFNADSGAVVEFSIRYGKSDGGAQCRSIEQRREQREGALKAEEENEKRKKRDCEQRPPCHGHGHGTWDGHNERCICHCRHTWKGNRCQTKMRRERYCKHGWWRFCWRWGHRWRFEEESVSLITPDGETQVDRAIAGMQVLGNAEAGKRHGVEKSTKKHAIRSSHKEAGHHTRFKEEVVSSPKKPTEAELAEQSKKEEKEAEAEKALEITGAAAMKTPDEFGVQLQYRIHPSQPWQTFKVYPVAVYGERFSEWYRTTALLPPAANSANVALRWFQPDHGCQCCDPWALDNIKITAGGVTAAVSVESSFELFIDGQRLGAGRNWEDTFRFRMNKEFETVAIKAVGKGGEMGILGTFGPKIVTSQSWRCTSVLTNEELNSWMYKEFDDRDWNFATLQGSNGAEPWGTRPGIAKSAQWLWVGDTTQDLATAYCRVTKDKYDARATEKQKSCDLPLDLICNKDFGVGAEIDSSEKDSASPMSDVFHVRGGDKKQQSLYKLEGFLQELKKVSNGNLIKRALLRVKVIDTGSKVSVCPVSSPWPSTSVTWSKKPNYDDKDCEEIDVSKAGWIEIDMSRWMRIWIEDPQKNYGMLFKSNSPDMVGIASPVSDKGGDRPRLVLQCHGAVEGNTEIDTYQEGVVEEHIPVGSTVATLAKWTEEKNMKCKESNVGNVKPKATDFTDLEKCKKMCEETPGCTAVTWYGDSAPSAWAEKCFLSAADKCTKEEDSKHGGSIISYTKE